MATTAGVALGIQRAELASGVSLLHHHATANPSVIVRALIRAGASRDRPEARGMATLVGRMLRQGTQSISKAALAEELDGMGAGLSIDVGFSAVSMSIKCLSADFPRATEILAEVLSRPTFPESELPRVRSQLLTDFQEMQSDTRAMSERAWRQMAYPPEHPYHSLVVGSPDTAEQVTRDQLVDFHQRWYGTHQTSLVVVGDVALDQARDRLDAACGGWFAGDPEPVARALSLPPTVRSAPETRVVELPGKSQADLLMGLPAVSRTDPDYYPLAFANHVLGRMYFMGRLGAKVRDEQGLAYYATSELHGGFGRGPWLVRAGVNPVNLARARESIETEIRRFHEEGPTETEHADAIASLVGSLPRNLETNEGVASVLGEIHLYDLGLDYIERYPSIVRSVQADQVVNAARRWLLLNGMATAIAGPEGLTADLT